jgi:hypothetical protein
MADLVVGYKISEWWGGLAGLPGHHYPRSFVATLWISCQVVWLYLSTPAFRVLIDQSLVVNVLGRLEHLRVTLRQLLCRLVVGWTWEGGRSWALMLFSCVRPC